MTHRNIFTYSIPTVLLCLYGYIGATLTPANLHEEVGKMNSKLG